MRTNASIWIACLALTGLVGCSVEEAPSLLLSSFHGLEAKDGACVHTDNPINSRTFDVQIADELGLSYLVYVRLENGLVSNENLDQGQIDTHRIEVRRIHVSFEGADWETLPGPVDIPIAGVLIEPGGEYFTAVGAIPPAAVEVLAANEPTAGGKPRRLEARVVAHGKTLDGSEVRSNPLSFEVQACDGCLSSSCSAYGGMLLPLCEGSFAQSDGVECFFDEAPPSPDVDA